VETLFFSFGLQFWGAKCVWEFSFRLKLRKENALFFIGSPTHVPWGQNIFQHYLGDDSGQWAEWDSCSLLTQADQKLSLLIDQGKDDEFLHQLRPDLLEKAAQTGGHRLTLRQHEGYDHSYYFVSSFLEDHFDFHGAALFKKAE